MDSGPYTVDVDTGEISGPGLNAFTNENPRDWASRLNAAYAAGVSARAKAADAVVEALRTIERMSAPLNFSFTGAGTKLRMGPTALAKAAEIHGVASAALRAAGE